MRRLKLLTLTGYCLFAMWVQASTSPSDSLLVHLEAGQSLNDEGKYGEAESLLRKTLHAFEQVSDSVSLAKTIFHLGVSLNGQGQFAEARQLFEQAASMSTNLGDQDTRLQALGALATLINFTGEYHAAIKLVKQCLQIIEQYQVREDKLPELQCFLGGSYHSVNEPDSARYWLETAYRNASEKEQFGIKALAISGLGQGYNQKGEYNRAYECYVEALEYYKAEGKEIMVMTTMRKIIPICRAMGLLDNALQYAEASLEISEKYGFKKSYAQIKQSLGNVYRQMGDTAQAMKQYQESLELNRALKDRHQTHYALLNIGHVHRVAGDFEAAHQYYQEALEVAINHNRHKRNMANAQLGLGQVAVGQQRFAEALGLLDESAAFYRQRSEKPKLSAALLASVAAYKGLGRYEDAFRAEVEYSHIRDSLLSEENSKHIREMEAKYQNAKKEREIAQLNQERELKEGALQRRRSLILVLLTGLFSIVGIAVFYYQTWRKNQVLAFQREEIAQRKIKKLERDQQLISMYAMVMGQENERRRIARDLHDGLGGLLSSVRAYFGSLEGQMNNQQDLDRYAATNGMLDHAAKEVRRIAHDLMPGALTKIGLVEAVQDLAESIEAKAGVRVSLQQINLEERLPTEIEINLYRIIEEITGILTGQPQVTKLIIQLSRYEDEFTLSIEDDGAGFDSRTVDASKQLGLDNVSSRVQLLDGNLEVYSMPGEGTGFTVQVPIVRGRSMEPVLSADDLS